MPGTPMYQQEIVKAVNHSEGAGKPPRDVLPYNTAI